MSSTSQHQHELSSRPTVMEVNLKAVSTNYQAMKKLCAGSLVMAVLKANAYGHGLVETALALEKRGVDYLGVALLEEGLMLRAAGVRAPIHVFGGVLFEQIESFIEHDLEITASSVDKLHACDAAGARLGKKAIIHLKIDTGMGRIGVNYRNAAKLFAAAHRASNCVIRGVFSHLATAEESDQSFARLQIERFLECVRLFGTKAGDNTLFHLANSAGALLFPEARLSMIRTGLALYGVNPVPEVHMPLVPALTLKTKVVYFKVVEAGTPISYGCTWKAPQQTRIVTIPIGYGDGFFRALSNKGSVLIRGKRYPIVGKICMDQMMVNIGWDEAYNGDEVVLLGKQGSELITAEEIAALAGTVEHEVLTSTNARVPRHFL